MLNTTLSLPGTPDDGLARRMCAQCGNDVKPHDGVEVAGKWRCGRCWRLRVAPPKPKKKVA